VELAHTSGLKPDTLAAIRSLLDDAFRGELTDDDWQHCLGGMHALLWDGDELIGHASVTQRRVIYGRRALRTGYVEGLAVREDWRRQGHGRALMDPVERIVRGAHELGALSATDDGVGFYTALGWQLWEGPTYGLSPTGIVRTEEDDGSVFVLPVSVELDVTGELTCDWRDGDVW
jgi:aminoglycoside 2'-N-acetyltransferase I